MHSNECFLLMLTSIKIASPFSLRCYCYDPTFYLFLFVKAFWWTLNTDFNGRSNKNYLQTNKMVIYVYWKWINCLHTLNVPKSTLFLMTNRILYRMENLFLQLSDCSYSFSFVTFALFLQLTTKARRLKLYVHNKQKMSLSLYNNIVLWY